VIGGGNAAPACRLCGGELAAAFTIPRAPASVERLLAAHEVEQDGPSALHVHQCRRCGLVQLVRLMPDGFYEDYEMAVTFSPRFKRYLETLAEAFITRTNLSDGRLAEIGCGDGSFLECFARRGFDVTGVEPSARFRRLAASKRLTLHASYVGKDAAIPDGPYDAVVTRQVLEHVPDVNGFLAGMRASMTPTGHGLIEVPSLECAVVGRRFYDFFPDHVNYFAAETLDYACRRNGLTIQDIVPTLAGEYITAFVTSGPLDASEPPPPTVRADVTAIGAAVATTVSSLEAFLRECRAKGRRVAAWGSGGKGVATFAAAGNLDDIAYVVDGDPRKQGCYMPVSHFQVYPPQRLREEPVDCVLVTAMAHAPEIENLLRGELAFEGTIAFLGDNIGLKEKVDTVPTFRDAG